MDQTNVRQTTHLSGKDNRERRNHSRKDGTMYSILIDALCLDCYSEQFLIEGANIEALMENIVALVMLDFFGDVTIKGIRAIYVSATPGQSSSYHLIIQAASFNGTIDVPLDTLELRLEEAISCVLLDHFHTVVINAIDVQAQ